MEERRNETMDKGYSGLNPYKSKPSLPLVNASNTHKVEAMRSYDNVVVIKAEDIISEHVEKAIKGHPYAHPKHSPVKIPYNASVEKKRKNGYEQVKYAWESGKYRYESRWHTSTPGAPNKKQSWVVTRIKKGVGYGKNASAKQTWVLSGKTWVSMKTWQDAIKARKNGAATKAQLKLLNNGHFTRKRGKK